MGFSTPRCDEKMASNRQSGVVLVEEKENIFWSPSNLVLYMRIVCVRAFLCYSFVLKVMYTSVNIIFMMLFLLMFQMCC